MKNDYEFPDVGELGRARRYIQGSKTYWPDCWDDLFGSAWKWIGNDIDESDE